MIKIDISLREIVSNLPHRFIQILTNKKGVKLLDTSLPNVKDKRADLIVELEDKTIFHLEIQTYNDTNMPYRMLEYYLLIKQKYNNADIEQMVLFVGEKLNMCNCINEKNLKFNYILKDIKQIECSYLMSSDDLEDKILAVLCNIEDEDLYINTIINEILLLDEKKRKDYIKKLLSLSRYRKNINSKLITAMKERVMPITINLQDDPYFQQGIQQGIQQGLSMGIRALYEMGLSINEIAKKFNLTKKQVENFLKENNATSQNR